MALRALLIRCMTALDLPEGELDFLAAVLVQAMLQRAEELSSAVEAAQSHLESFESKYGMDFAEFSQAYLEHPGEYSQGEYVNWAFWDKVRRNRTALLNRYDQLTGTVN